jgi:S1-C subfamily serine protease
MVNPARFVDYLEGNGPQTERCCVAKAAAHILDSTISSIRRHTPIQPQSEIERTSQPSHPASSGLRAVMPYRGGTLAVLESLLMAEATNPLIAFSDHAAQLVEYSARSIVAIRGGGRWSSSGIHWRSGVIVTAEEVLERDEDIKVTLPGGHLVEASLAGRDPSTDVAVLRFQPDALPIAQTADAASLRPGQVVMAIGNHDGAPIASFGIVALARGAWHSLRGGTIDSLIRLDLALSPVAEGGALIDVQGGVVGMAVLGPRRRVLAIPRSTIDRVVDQLLAKGHVFRGYLGAGLRPVQFGRPSDDQQPSVGGRGVLVVSIDPDGPAAHGGLLVGDIVTDWNANPIDRVRQVMRLLEPDSVGTIVDLGLLRGGAPLALKVVIGQRPVA